MDGTGSQRRDERLRKSHISLIAWRVRFCERGAIALEFALIAPLLFALLGGLIEFGNIFLVKSEMTNTARETVRRLSVNAVSENQATRFAEDGLATVSKASFEVGIVETEINDDHTDLTVEISVPLTDIMLLDLDALISMLSGNDTGSSSDGITLSSSATMLKE